MRQLRNWLYNKLANSAPLETLGLTGVHIERAPSEATYPYAVIVMMAPVNESEDSAGVCIIHNPTAIRVVDLNDDRAAEIAEAVEGVLGRGPYDLPGNERIMRIESDGFFMQQDPDRDAEGNEVWLAIGSVVFVVQRNPFE